MATVNILNRSDLGTNGVSRFDAEAFDADVMAAERKLLKLGGKTLAKTVGGATVLKFRVADEKSAAVEYCSISSVDAQDGAVFSETYAPVDLPSRAQWIVAHGDILVSQVRPERGAVSRVPIDLDGAIASSGFFAIPASKLPTSLAAALYLFMRTPTARRQLVRRNRNSMFPAVAPHDVGSIVVPKFSKQTLDYAEKTITSLIALRAIWLAKRAELTALVDDLLISTGAPPSPLVSARAIDTTTIRRADAYGKTGAGRFDAEFFRGEYQAYDDAVLTTKSFKLGDAFEVFAGARIDGEDLVPVFKQGALTNSGLNLSAIDEELCKRGSGKRVRDGDILIASTAHEIEYVGKKVDLVRGLPPELQDNQAVAELMVLRPKKGKKPVVSSAFVVDFLRHEAGRHQVQRCIRGLRGGHTYSRDIQKYVRVPLPPKPWMERYDKLAGESDSARDEGVKLSRAAEQQLQADVLASLASSK